MRVILGWGGSRGGSGRLRSGALWQHAVAACLIAALGFGLHRIIPRIPCITDEPAWITAGQVTLKLVTSLASPGQWEQAYDRLGLEEWGNLNPPVGKLMIGAASARVLVPSDTVEYRWDWQQSPEWNYRFSPLPPQRVLWGAREGIALAGALCLALSYLIALELVRNKWLALWAPLALYLTPVFRIHAVLAYTDVPQLLFMLASAWLYLLFLRQGHWTILGLSLVAMGLACAVKLSAAPIVGAGFIMLAKVPGPWRARSAAAAGVLLLPWLTWVAVNPYLYPAPLERTLRIVAGWSRSVLKHQQDPTLVQQVVGTRREAAALTLKRALISQDNTTPHDKVQPGSFGQREFWAGLAVVGALAWRRRAGSDRAYRRSLAIWTALGLLVVAGYYYLHAAAGGASLLLLLGGMARAIREVASGEKTKLAASHGFTALLLLVFTTSTTLWLPFDWPRYYLPLLVWTPLVQVMGLAELSLD